MKTLPFLIFLFAFSLLAEAQSIQSVFLNNGYRSDSVVISGQILNRTTQFVPRIRYTHLITGELVDISAPTDDSGNFRVTVPVFNTTPLFIHQVAKGMSISLLAEPGEQIFVRSDWNDDTVKFEGTRAKDHQQVFDYHLYLEGINRLYTNLDSPDELSHDSYLQKIKQCQSQEDSLLNNYLKLHPDISEKAKQEIAIGTLNAIAFSLMQRRYSLDRINGEKFSRTYMDYADSLFKALPSPYTIVSTTFLSCYLDYYGETQRKVPTFKQESIEYAIRKGLIQPTQEQKKDFSLICKSKELQEKIQEAHNTLLQSEKYARILLDYYNGGVMIVPMPAILKELMTTRNFYRFLKDNRIALSDTNLKYYKQQVNSPELQKFVLDYQQKLDSLESRKPDYTKSLKNASSFKNYKSGEELFKHLIAPYKGKIIYLDIWGTWCGACKKQMSHAVKIKEAMQGKEIIFLYLANNSPEMSWKNVIKESNLTGKQSVHYNLPAAQQELLEKYLNVRHYPTYLIIDREGKIIENEATLRPDSGQKLINHLNKLLSE